MTELVDCPKCEGVRLPADELDAHIATWHTTPQENA